MDQKCLVQHRAHEYRTDQYMCRTNEQDPLILLCWLLIKASRQASMEAVQAKAGAGEAVQAAAVGAVQELRHWGSSSCALLRHRKLCKSVSSDAIEAVQICVIGCNGSCAKLCQQMQ
eukprot:scaffold25753_cov21-Tisochrysis_lutea.AAC.6